MTGHPIDVHEIHMIRQGITSHKGMSMNMFIIGCTWKFHIFRGSNKLRKF